MVKSPIEAVNEMSENAIKIKLWVYVLRSNKPEAQRQLDIIKEHIEPIIDAIDELKK